jgi:hypothetical protein
MYVMLKYNDQFSHLVVRSVLRVRMWEVCGDGSADMGFLCGCCAKELQPRTFRKHFIEDGVVGDLEQGRVRWRTKNGDGKLSEQGYKLHREAFLGVFDTYSRLESLLNECQVPRQRHIEIWYMLKGLVDD